MIHEIKQVLGISKANERASERLKTCKACIFSVHNRFGTWCGSPLIGGQVEYETADHVILEADLCGCKMENKVKGDSYKCPVNNW